MNATGLLMQVHLSLFGFLYFLFLTRLGITYRRLQGVCICLYLSVMYRRPQVQPYLSSFACILLLYTWSSGGEWPLSPLGNSLLLRFKLLPIYE